MCGVLGNQIPTIKNKQIKIYIPIWAAPVGGEGAATAFVVVSGSTGYVVGAAAVWRILASTFW